MQSRKKSRLLNSLTFTLLAIIPLVLPVVAGCQKADQATRDLQAKKLSRLYQPKPRFDKNATPFDNLRVKVGDRAPVISGPDTNGIEFNLSEYRGKVVLLNYWANW